MRNELYARKIPINRSETCQRSDAGEGENVKHRNWIHPLVARRSMRALRANPDDTAAAIRVIGALAGNSGGRQFRRFRRSERGAQILREKRDLNDFLMNQERLKTMPPGSLGHTIAEWFEREGISAEGLAEAGNAAAGGTERLVDADVQVYGTRMRNLHDVFHVLTGYDRDLRGEAAVLAFTIAQNFHRGIAYLVWNAIRAEGWNSPGGRLIREAYGRGRRAEPLAKANWEKLLAQPLEVVREDLGLGPPPSYEQVRSMGAPALP